MKSKHQDAIKVFSNPELAEFLRAQSLLRFDDQMRKRAQDFLNSFQYMPTDSEKLFPDLYDLAIDKVKSIVKDQMPHEKRAILTEAFQIAQTQRAYCEMSDSDQLTSER